MYVLMLSAFAALTVFFAALSIMLGKNSDRIAAKRRLIGMDIAADDARRMRKEKRKRSADSNMPMRSKDLFDKVADELAGAGILMRAEEFMILWLLLSVVPAGLCALVWHNIITATALAVVFLVLPPLLVSRAKLKRVAQFDKQLGEALIVISNCLQSGLTLAQAMESIAAEMPDPIAREFARVLREIKLGSNMDRALESMEHRIKSDDLMLIVSAINIQRQLGGNLSEILENIAQTIKERLKLRDDIRVLTATGKTSGIIIGGLPLVIALLLMIINPSYIRTFVDTSQGRTMLIVAAMMELTGFLFVKKITTIKY